MRTRTRNIIEEQWPAQAARSIQLTSYPCTGSSSTSTITDGAYPAINCNTVSERMSDTLGKGQAHAVVHKRSHRRLNLIGSDSWVNITPPYGRWHYGVNNLVALRYYSNASNGSFGLSHDVNNASSVPQGWSIAWPTVNESSVFNDLKEKAHQLKADVLLNIIEANSTWQSIKSIASLLPRLRGGLPALAAYVRKHRRRPWSSAGDLSSNYLAWKFGIAPLVNDLRNIAKFAPDMLRQYNQFKRQRNIIISKKYDGNATFAIAPSNGIANGVTYAAVTYQGFATWVPTLRYVLVVKPNRSEYLSEAFTFANFLLSRFTTSPAQLAWEKIPFSFMVDWFVDVRGCLDKLDRAIGVEPYSVVSFTKSTKWGLNSRKYLQLRTPCASNSLLWDGCLCEVDDSHYERSVLSGSSLVTWKPRFGKSQAAITAALIGQQLSRLRSVR